jgi:hypothetical protein
MTNPLFVLFLLSSALSSIKPTSSAQAIRTFILLYGMTHCLILESQIKPIKTFKLNLLSFCPSIGTCLWVEITWYLLHLVLSPTALRCLGHKQIIKRGH